MITFENKQSAKGLHSKKSTASGSYSPVGGVKGAIQQWKW